MLARVLKNIMRRYMRSMARRTNANVALAHENCILYVLNCMSGSHARTEEFWALEILPGLVTRFGERCISAQERKNLRIAALPVLPYALRRLASMMNLVFSAHVTPVPPPVAGGVYDPSKDVEAAPDGADAAHDLRTRTRLMRNTTAKVAAGTPSPSMRGAGPHAMPMLLQSATSGVSSATRAAAAVYGVGTLERFALHPNGFVFTSADVAECDAKPRVKHNMVRGVQ